MNRAIRILDTIFTNKDGVLSMPRALGAAVVVFAAAEAIAPGSILFPALAALLILAAGYAAHIIAGREEEQPRDETDYGAPPEPHRPSEKKKAAEKEGRIRANFSSGGGGGGPANKGATGPRVSPPGLKR